MYRLICLFLCVGFLFGCAATSKTGGVKAKTDTGIPVRSGVSKETKPPAPLPKGIVFAKTVFEGVVKASYVRLSLVPQAEPENVIHLYLGDRLKQQSFPWVSGTVDPDYFIIELPPGEYRFTEIAIPVGTTLAVEALNIKFTVESAKGIYLGTLSVNGTRERVRLGGVPVLRPGFEYEVKVLDERASAVAEFHQRLPRFHGDVKVRLMEVQEPQREMPSLSSEQ